MWFECIETKALNIVPRVFQLTYRIISGNKAGLVDINKDSGEILLSPSLNTNVPILATMEVSVSGRSRQHTHTHAHTTQTQHLTVTRKTASQRTLFLEKTPGTGAQHLSLAPSLSIAPSSSFESL